MGFRCATKLFTSRQDPSKNVQARIAHSNSSPATQDKPDAESTPIATGNTAQCTAHPSDNAMPYRSKTRLLLPLFSADIYEYSNLITLSQL